MTSDLYLSRAYRYVEADPVRGISASGMEYDGYTIVVASSADEANAKLLARLKETTRYRTWEISDTKKLTAGADTPLEKRVEILREVFPVVD
jgi:hypothetical protein